jgi:MFS family permease
MLYKNDLTKTNLRTPKAAAIAGILFSILLLVALWLLRISIPAESLAPNRWLHDQAKPIALALGLIPFAGIAFLWFIGVLRDRLGQREDRFFATVFLGSGLLFLAMLFSATAVAGAIVTAFAAAPNLPIDAQTFAFARTLASDLMNVYAVKMAGVFMISTSTVAIYTQFAPRYLGFLGYVLALLLLFGSQYLEWSFFVFPSWVLLLSIHMLVDKRCLQSRRDHDDERSNFRA